MALFTAGLAGMRGGGAFSVTMGNSLPVFAHNSFGGSTGALGTAGTSAVDGVVCTTGGALGMGGGAGIGAGGITGIGGVSTNAAASGFTNLRVGSSTGAVVASENVPSHERGDLTGRARSTDHGAPGSGARREAEARLGPGAGNGVAGLLPSS